MTATTENTRAVRKQIGRLRSIELVNDAQLSELASEAIRRFPSPMSVQRAVDSCVSERDRVPTPHQFGDLARMEAVRSGVGCAACSGTGFQIRRDRRQTIDGVREVEVAYACRCHPRGRQALG